jgi:hypothetical protein
MLSRRDVLSGAAGLSTAVLIMTGAKAHKRTTLEASVDILGDAVDSTGEIGVVDFAIRNERQEEIQPVALLWGQGRQAQLPWDIVRGPDVVPGGESAEYRVHAPRNDEMMRLHPGVPAQLVIYDEGTEDRTEANWTPTSHGEHI